MLDDCMKRVARCPRLLVLRYDILFVLTFRVALRDVVDVFSGLRRYSKLLGELFIRTHYEEKWRAELKVSATGTPEVWFWTFCSTCLGGCDVILEVDRAVGSSAPRFQM